MLNLNLCLAMADGSGGGGAAQADPMAGIYQMLMLIVPMGIFFYFFMIRPEKKRRQEREQVLNSVKAKDKVVTIGGVHGTVVDVEKDSILLLVDQKKDVKIRFRRTAIDSVESGESDEKK